MNSAGERCRGIVGSLESLREPHDEDANEHPQQSEGEGGRDFESREEPGCHTLMQVGAGRYVKPSPVV
jgi:hypothetical protein